MVPWELQELAFVQCVVRNMDRSQLLYLKENLGITNTSDTSTLSAMTYAYLRSNNTDCTGCK
jgi:hypothetical protein